MCVRNVRFEVRFDLDYKIRFNGESKVKSKVKIPWFINEKEQPLRVRNAELRRQLREHAATVMYKAEYGKDGS